MISFAFHIHSETIPPLLLAKFNIDRSSVLRFLPDSHNHFLKKP
jgi:hypothetical protein